MIRFATPIILVGMLAVVGCSSSSSHSVKTGPFGGDIVPLKEGTYAEILANADTGEVMLHTWDKDLKTSYPIEKTSFTLGSGNHSLELSAHPTERDPAGYSSRFYGRADWVRGGDVRHGWLHPYGYPDQRQQFEWNQCWQGGQSHGPMWSEMGEHRDMSSGHHSGHMGGRGR